MEELTEYSRGIVKAMNELAPNWVRTIPSETHGRGEIEFVLVSPTKGVPEMVLSTADDELTLHWAFSHRHLTYTGEPISPRESVMKALTLTRDIESENRIAVEGRRGRWFGKFWGIVPLAEFHDLRHKGRVIKAVSWRGTYVV